MVLHSVSSQVRPVLLACGLALLGACAGEASDDAIDGASDLEASAAELKLGLPPIPAGLAVPSGNRLLIALPAEGVQIYDCKAATDGTPTWTFRAPVAELTLFGHVVITHYAGPTWEALDGSTVVGTRVAGASVDASAIPWLLLQGTGHSGRGIMSKVTYIHRLETVGGLAPSSGCDTEHFGDVAEVDYSATYAFYVASRAKPW